MVTRSLLLVVLLLGAVGCSEELDLPSASESRDLVDRPVTAATARATTAASVWATNDLAAMAARWADGDLRGTPTRLDPSDTDDDARFDDEAKRWTVPLTSDFQLGSEIYAVTGTATITFRDGTGVPVRESTDATTMNVTVIWETLPRLGRLQRDLDLRTELALSVTDLSARPLALEGSGLTAGRYSLVDDTIDQRTTVDLTWTFALDTVYRDCCPSGTADLVLDAWRTTVSLDGAPEVSTELAVGDAGVEDIAVDLPCVRVNVAQGSLLRSAGPVRRAAAPDVRVLDVLVDEATASLPRTDGVVRVTGRLGDADFAPILVTLDPTTTFEDMFTAVRAALTGFGSWDVAFGFEADGRPTVDTSIEDGDPRPTTEVRVRGNLDPSTEGAASRLRTLAPLRSPATGDDALDALFGGAAFELAEGDEIFLRGTIGRGEISGVSFTVGTDGDTLEDLRAWFDQSLRFAGAIGVTVGLDPDGRLVVDASTGSLRLEAIRLVVAGNLEFNAAMTFGEEIMPGATGASAAVLLAPARADDRLSALSDGGGEPLRFAFDASGFASIEIGARVAGNVVPPETFSIERDVTTLDAVLAWIETTASADEPAVATLDDEGRVVLVADVGLANAIEDVTVAERTNPTSNLEAAFGFAVVEIARDPDVTTAGFRVVDSLGARHDARIGFTKRSGEAVWDYAIEFDDDSIVTGGATGSIGFDDAGARTAPGPDAPIVRVTPAGGNAQDVVFTLDFGGAGDLTQFVAEALIVATANGRGVDPTGVPSSLLFELIASDGASNSTLELARFDDLVAGTVYRGPRWRVPATVNDVLGDLVGSSGVSLFDAAGGSSRTVEITRTLDGATTTSTHPFDPTVATVADFVEVVRAALGFDAEAVFVTADGHVVVQAPAGSDVLSALAVREVAVPNPVVAATWAFEVEALGAGGCW